MYNWSILSSKQPRPPRAARNSFYYFCFLAPITAARIPKAFEMSEPAI